MTAYGTPVIDGYTVLDLLGAGASADVWRVRDAAGQELAAKVFTRGAGTSGRKEWRALQNHRGPHIMPVLDYVSDEAGHGVIVMPLMSGGSLQEVVSGRGGLTAGELVTALAPMAGALAALHKAGSVHGDVTPRNVLFDGDGKPILSDLGTRSVPAMGKAAQWGTDGFIAPEVLDGLTPGAPADVYALGATAWFALTGQVPPIPAMRPRLADVVSGLPDEMAEVITACLSVTPTARPTAAQCERQLTAACESVALPLDQAAGSQNAGMITRRLRDEAQRNQLRQAQAAPVAAKNKGLSLSPRVLVPSAVAVGLLTAAFVWPTGGSDERQVAKVVSQQMANAKTSGSPAGPASKPSTSNVAVVSETDVRALLNCRAAAWNARSTANLVRCMASDSPALKDDTAALTQAQQRGVTYKGVGYSVDKLALHSASGTTRVFTAIVTRSAFTATQGGKDTQLPEQTSEVKLTVTGEGHDARITQWSVQK